MKRKLFLFQVLIFTIQYLSAQENFQKGYIITEAGEKQEGFINYKNWNKNPKKIQFKATEAGEIQTLTPLTCSQFKVADEVYEGTILDVDKSLLRTAALSTSPVPDFRTDTVFISKIVSGEKNLYQHRDLIGRNHFFVKTEKGFEYLLYRKFIKSVNGARKVKTDLSYRGVLLSYLSGCPDAPKWITKLNYEKNDLIALYKNFYKCIGSKPDFIRKKGNPKISFSAFAGVAFTNFQIADLNTHIIQNIDFSLSPGIVLGAGLNYAFPRNRGKLSSQNELLYTQYSFSDNYDAPIFPEYTKFYDVKISNRMLKLNSLLRYKFSAHQTSPYIESGLSLAHSVSSENKEIRSEEHHGKFEVTGEFEAFPDYIESEVGFLLGVGYSYNKLFGSIRYERSTGPANPPDYKANTNRLYFLVGYNF